MVIKMFTGQKVMREKIGKVVEKIRGRRVGGIRVVRTSFKIILIFTIFILSSNLSSNYINLTMNQAEIIKYINQLLVRDLKDIHVFASGQFEIFQYSRDENDAMSKITESAEKNFKRPHALAIGITPDGKLRFTAARDMDTKDFRDNTALDRMNENLKAGKKEGTLTFSYGGKSFFGVYKYNEKWKMFIVRAEDLKELYRDSNRIFFIITLIIILITGLCVAAGVLILNSTLQFIKTMADQIMTMQQKQTLDLINMDGAVNDDVAYLGFAFNNLSNTIDNLVTIFRKFVARDVAVRAYKEKEIRLEGVKKELAVLFTDIKGFTYMTETLGTDIIKLLNIHYDRAIREIMEKDGDIGSIIGDALLAIFGVTPQEGYNKSLAAIEAGYCILNVAADLRQEMYKYESEIVRTRGFLNELEKKILKAVLIEVGVGIDGGEVFYGNIGSTDRMVNTVIGDNVNSSSRLEGLTRFYHVPIICSEFIKDDTLTVTDRYVFVELDMVQVKGKTVGKRIFWPLDKEVIDSDLKDQLEFFSKGLVSYYGGDWKAAIKQFDQCALPLVSVFKSRIEGKKAPEDWNGIWTMKEK
jgi:class 3 adenylate cyclase